MRIVTVEIIMIHITKVMIGYHGLIRYSISNHKPHPILRDICGLNQSLLLYIVSLHLIIRITALLQCGAP